MNPVSNPLRFGRIHVLSRQVNAAFTEAFTQKTIPSGLPQEARIKIHNGEDVFSALMGDDKSRQFQYYKLDDGRGVIITNKDTPDRADFNQKLKAEKALGQKVTKSDFCNRFLSEKSVGQIIHWLWSRNDPDKP